MKQYIAAISFRRTPEERRDMFLAWSRSDKAFFAAGACHILAETFMQMHPNQGGID